MTSPVLQDERVEACPGVRHLHQAEDGLLARIRIPGGLIEAEQLAGLSALAVRYGQPELELTSRANLQLRGVRPEAAEALMKAVAELGLLPSADHELIRNVVASPLAGLISGETDQPDRSDHEVLDDLVRALDRALCAGPELTGLSARFLFGLDAGFGDVAALAPDAWAAPTRDGRWWVAPAAVEVERDQVVHELVRASVLFAGLPEHPRRWANLSSELAEDCAVRLRDGRPAVPAPRFEDRARPVGVIGDAGRPVAVVAQAPLGRLDPRSVAALVGATGSASELALRLTPWGSVVLPLATAHLPTVVAELTAAGLVIGDSLWTTVSACTGRPGCGKALADVRADARRAVARGITVPEGSTAPPTVPVHWSGCSRRCGRPAGRHVDVLATESGYRVTQA